MQNTAAPTPPLTRQKTGTVSSKKPLKDPTSTEEANTDIHTKAQAIKLLTSKDYLAPGTPVNLQILANVLLQLVSASSKMPKALTDIILATAVLINDYASQHLVDEI